MKSVRVSKEELLQKVRTNREKHIAEFTETLAGYKQDVAAALKKQHQNATKGNPVDLHSIVMLASAPQSYEKDYDRTIAMLEMETSEIIELSAHEFNQLVLDEWAWRGQFELAASTYNKARM